MKKPLIYLTNDDGLRSPGLMALANEIDTFADIEIIAPSSQMTATGRGLFGDRGLTLKQEEIDINGRKHSAYHSLCSPAQVVMLGVQVLRGKREPDLLISGINYGENLGRDITMSGTVGAAIQAACMGIPALAVSLETEIDLHFEYGEVDWEVACHFAGKFAKLMLERTLPDDVSVLKLDVPAKADKTTPWKVTRMAGQSNFLAQIESPNPSSTLRDAKIQINPNFEDSEENSDIRAVHLENTVSLTPISLDSTSRVELDKLQYYLENGKD